jgi:hypothetical protein
VVLGFQFPAFHALETENRKLGLIVARDRFDGGDHLFVWDFIGAAEEAGIAAVHEDGSIALSVAAQGADELPSFGVVKRTEVHGQFSLFESASGSEPEETPR